MDETKKVGIVLSWQTKGEKSIGKTAKNLDKIEKKGKKVERQNKLTGRSFLDMNKAALAFSAVAVFAIGRVAGRAIGLASDFAETQSKFNVIFTGMEDQANQWAENFGKTMGRSELQMKTFLSGVADVINPLGFATDETFKLSKALTGLAIDVASFKNASDEQVIRSFTSALTGERESLKSLGIVISEADVKNEAFRLGLLKGKEALSKQSKALATINLLYENTKTSHGDLARTAEGYANQMKFLKSRIDDFMVSFGENMIPAILMFIQQVGPTLEAVLGDVGGSVDSASKKTGSFGQVFATVVEVLRNGLLVVKTVFTIMGRIIGTAVAGIFDQFRSLGTIFKQVFSGDFKGALSTAKGFFNNFGSGVNSAVSDINADLSGMSSKLGESVDRIKVLYNEQAQTDKLEAAKNKRIEYAKEELSENKKSIAELVDVYKNSTSKIGASSSKVGAGMKKIGAEVDKSVEKYKSLKVKAGEALSKLTNDHTESSKKIAENIDKTKKKIDELNASFAQSASEAQSGLAGALIDQEKKVSELKGQIGGEEDAGERSNLQKILAKEEKALNDFNKKSLVSQEAISEARRREQLTSFERFVEDLTSKQEERKKDFEEKTAMLEAEVLALQEQAKVEDLLYAEKRAIIEKTQSTFEQFESAYISGLDNIGAKTASVLPKVEEQIGKIESALKRLKSLTAPTIGPDNRSLQDVSSQYGVNDPFPTGQDVFSKRQFGGFAAANKPVIVGEKGPELFVPHSSGSVERFGGGEAPSMKVEINIGSVDDENRIKQIANAVSEQMTRFYRRKANLGINL